MKTCRWFEARPTFYCTLVILLFQQSASVTTLFVYNTNDSGPGSLRQAISDNKALGGGNTVVFSNIVSGTIILTSGRLSISNDVSITGPGANVLAVSGNNANRVFNVANATVTISGLTIKNGRLLVPSFPNGAGAGIFNDHGILTISNCTISGNSVNSVGGIGAGICNYGGGTNGTILTVVNSTISNNSAGSGGGIYNDSSAGGSATLTIRNSTISDNSASSIGGGGLHNNSGSGSGTVTIISSTFSGSSANQGASIYNTGMLTLGSTILTAGNSNENIFQVVWGTIIS